MPRRRVKTRVEHLADAHADLLRAQTSLKEVDLRTTSGDLREAIRESREQVGNSLDAISRAIQLDIPRK